MVTIADTLEPPTVVVFRTYRTSGEVIALMPHDVADAYGNCACYVHVGQHGVADYRAVIQVTRPATLEELTPLKRELESAPYFYRFVVRQRR